MTEPIRLPNAGHAPYRELPHNIEAEQALLGAILLDNRTLDRVPFLTAEHFHDGLHGQIFETAAAAVRKGRTASPVTLKTFFEGHDPIETDAGPLTVPQYLGRLAANAVSIINARDYGRAIYDLHVRRQVIALAADMAASAYDAPIDFPPDQQIDDAQVRLDALRLRERNERETIQIADAMAEAVDEANRAHMSGVGLAGLSTGLRSLDASLGGLAPSDLLIIGGRPSMGKTALVTTIAANVARAGTGVGFFSLEMSASQLGQRILAAETGIPASAQRRGDFGADDGMRKLMAGVKQYQDVPLFVDESGGMTLAQFAVKARRLARARRLGLLIIDYLQLMGGSQFRNSNRTQELTEITTGLKALAKELNVPVLALSQLSRKSEERDNKRPQLADLRESGSIEQDADVVLFCYREEYYLERKTPKPDEMAQWNADLARAAGMAEVIIAKHRHGPTCTVELGFDGPRTLFTDRGRT